MVQNFNKTLAIYVLLDISLFDAMDFIKDNEEVIII